MSQVATRELLKQITGCPEVRACRAGDDGHPCFGIVDVQRATPPDMVQLPEPWSGFLDHAPLLFISSNLSLSEDENDPTTSWTADSVTTYFNARFDLHKDHANHSQSRDGQWSKHPVRFWSAAQARATELWDRPVNPGVDYALTEVVHCKSRQEAGVASAPDHCADLYLGRVVSASPAVVLVVFGRPAEATVRRVLLDGSTSTPIVPVTVTGIERLVVFLPHPNARVRRTCAHVLVEDGLARVQAHLNTYSSQ